MPLGTALIFAPGRAERCFGRQGRAVLNGRPWDRCLRDLQRNGALLGSLSHLKPFRKQAFACTPHPCIHFSSHKAAVKPFWMPADPRDENPGRSHGFSVKIQRWVAGGGWVRARIRAGTGPRPALERRLRREAASSTRQECFQRPSWAIYDGEIMMAVSSPAPDKRPTRKPARPKPPDGQSAPEYQEFTSITWQLRAAGRGGHPGRQLPVNGKAEGAMAERP